MTPSHRLADPRAGGLPTFREPKTAPPFNAIDIQSDIIGGPGAGYGLKYGGFPTQSDYQNAIRGEAFATRELEALARQKAEQAIANRGSEYIDPVTTELSRSASMAGVRPGALMSTADRAKLMGGYQNVQEFGRTPEYEEIRELTRGSAPESPESSFANKLMRAAYNDMYNSPGYNEEDRRLVADMAERQLVNLPSVGRIFESPEVAGPQQLADLIKGNPVSQYAQQIAQARYGMDPNLARGLFGTDLDMKFAADEINAQQLAEGKPQLSDDQLAWRLLGPEGYMQYREDKILKLAYGSPEEIEKAEQDAMNLEMDLDIRDLLGFMPSDLSGVQSDLLRDAMQNPQFGEYVKTAMDTLKKEGGLDEYGGSAKELGNTLAQDWLMAGGSPIEAKLIAQILANFDFSF
jgi:hypothetical protein